MLSENKTTKSINFINMKNIFLYTHCIIVQGSPEKPSNRMCMCVYVCIHIRTQLTETYFKELACVVAEAWLVHNLRHSPAGWRIRS